MDEALEQQWKTLNAALDAARLASDRAHDDMLACVQSGGGAGRSLLQCCQAHDQAAEQWMDARRALIRFCKDHPAICKQNEQEAHAG